MCCGRHTEGSGGSAGAGASEVAPEAAAEEARSCDTLSDRARLERHSDQTRGASAMMMATMTRGAGQGKERERETFGVRSGGEG